MAGPEESRPTFLSVTNNGKGKFHARFHGEDYDWAAGESVNLSVEAAAHIFGYGIEDKNAAFLRSGWINTTANGTPEDAMRRFMQFSFQPAKQSFSVVGIIDTPAKAHNEVESKAVAARR